MCQKMARKSETKVVNEMNFLIRVQQNIGKQPQNRWAHSKETNPGTADNRGSGVGEKMTIIIENIKGVGLDTVTPKGIRVGEKMTQNYREKGHTRRRTKHEKLIITAKRELIGKEGVEWAPYPQGCNIVRIYFLSIRPTAICQCRSISCR